MFHKFQFENTDPKDGVFLEIYCQQKQGNLIILIFLIISEIVEHLKTELSCIWNGLVEFHLIAPLVECLDKLILNHLVVF